MARSSAPPVLMLKSSLGKILNLALTLMAAAPSVHECVV